MSATLSALSPQQRQRLAPRKRLSCVEFAEAHRFISDGPLLEGSTVPVKWRREYFPPATTFLEAIDNPAFSEVIILGSPQTTKTDTGVITPLLHRLFERGQTCMYVQTTEDKANDAWVKKIRPAIEASPTLSRFIPPQRDEAGKKQRRDFANGRSLFLAGSNSPGSLAQVTCACVVCDDVQDMPRTVGTHGHPVDLAKKRAGSFPERSRTVIILGTAGQSDDYHWRELLKSTFYRIYVPCLACGTYQLIAWERMQYDASSEESAYRECTLRCANTECTHAIRDDELPAMLKRYLWVATAGGNDLAAPPATIDPKSAPIYPASPTGCRTAGFHYTALYWPWHKWVMHARECVKGQGDPDKEKDFRQHTLVIAQDPLEADLDSLQPKDLEAALPDAQSKRGVAPEQVDLVTLQCDVHHHYLYYTVAGWRKADGARWLIDAGTIGVHGPKASSGLSVAEHDAHTESAVRRALDEVWKLAAAGWPRQGCETDASKNVHLSLALIDGRWRPNTVFTFTRLRNPAGKVLRWRMIFGRSANQGARKIWEETPKTLGGRVWWEINVDEAQGVLRELLAIPPGSPGCWRTYGDKPLTAYFRHLCSMTWHPEKRKWIKRRQGAGPNHWLDCEVYSIAAGLACGVKLSSGAAPLPGPRPQRRVESTLTPMTNSRSPITRRGPMRRAY